MARRERTTGLPRHQARARSGRVAGVGGVDLDSPRVRIAFIGFALALLVFVAGLLIYRWYEDTILHPRSVVLSVNDEEFRLNYYADRLTGWVQANQSVGDITLLHESLLRKLEEEAIIEIIARDRGIVVTQAEVTAAIAAALGVPPGSTGSAFDAAYRAALRREAMSDASYRRRAEAAEYQQRLTKALETDVGATGELIRLRIIAVPAEVDAQDIIARVRAGENMGTLAQTRSQDETSRAQDGLLDPVPTPLLQENITKLIEGKSTGDLLDPVQIGTQWWVIRLEERQADGTYTDEQRSQLASLRLETVIAERRAAGTLKIDRNFDQDDATWAQEHGDFTSVT